MADRTRDLTGAEGGVGASKVKRITQIAMSKRPEIEQIELRPVSGPPMDAAVVDSDRGAVIGRAATCEVELLDPRISRTHARIERRRGRWLIEDLGSRHGVYLGGARLDPDAPTPLDEGDLVSIGPWTFRIAAPGTDTGPLATLADVDVDGARVEAAARPGATARLAASQLSLLIDCVGALGAGAAGASEDELARRIVETAVAGSGFERAALLRAAEKDEVAVIAHAARDGDNAEPRFSRSLLRAASQGEIVRLAGAGAARDYGHSIAELEITAALCAPVMIGESPTAYLYLDARRDEARGAPNHAAFCEALARIYAMAIGNIKRVQLERRAQAMELDLNAAREAQRLIMPPATGRVGPVAYAMEMRPGRFVAGDLFDVVRLDEARTAVCLGDVTGEGIDAAVVMAATQAHLHGALRRGAALAEVVASVNEFLSLRSAPNRFVTLWAGVFDARSGELRYVDAGHGHWLIRRGSGGGVESPGASAIPLSIDAGVAFDERTIELTPGDRIVLYSDGVTEQVSPSGEEFGRDRLIEALHASADEGDDVRRIIDALRTFAGGQRWADDASAASVAFLGH